MDTNNKETRTTLITGCSGGLGLAIARELAARGFRLVLTARSEDVLRELSERLGAQYIVCDLSVEGGARELYDEVSRRGLKIDWLVNNAGAGKCSDTLQTDPETLRKLICLNAQSPALLCRLFGADMVSRGGGTILNVCSVVSMLPDPHFNVYAPTKAFLFSLCETLRGELYGKGVRVCALCPGSVRTNWCKNAGRADNPRAMSAEAVAKAAVKGALRGKPVIIPGFTNKLGVLCARLLPRGVLIKLCGNWQNKLKI